MVLPLPKIVPLSPYFPRPQLDHLHPHDPVTHPRTQEGSHLQIHLLPPRYLFGYLGHIFVAFFLLFDNVSVIMMMVGNQNYRIVRRVSYSIFLFGIVWQIISIAIKLRESFTIESDLKKNLEEMTPVQFLERLNEIDEERKLIAIEFVNLVGDFVPAMARTNMPEIIIRTKVNKGTVGFFGMIASLSGIVLKLKRRERLGRESR
jgi:hypothetical protein